MMSQDQYDSIEDLVRGYLNGCPDMVLRATIDTTVSRWIDDVRNLTAVCGPYDLRGHVSRFQVNAPEEGRVLRVAKVFTRRGELPTKEWTVMDAGYSKMLVLRNPFIGEPFISARIEWMPTARTEELPEEWFEANRRSIADGVLSMLLAQTDKPWAAPSLAANFMLEYNKDKANAIYDVKAEGSPGGQLSHFDPSVTLGGLMF